MGSAMTGHCWLVGSSRPSARPSTSGRPSQNAPSYSRRRLRLNRQGLVKGAGRSGSGGLIILIGITHQQQHAAPTREAGGVWLQSGAAQKSAFCAGTLLALAGGTAEGPPATALGPAGLQRSLRSTHKLGQGLCGVSTATWASQSSLAGAAIAAPFSGWCSSGSDDISTSPGACRGRGTGCKLAEVGAARGSQRRDTAASLLEPWGGTRECG